MYRRIMLPMMIGLAAAGLGLTPVQQQVTFGPPSLLEPLVTSRRQQRLRFAFRASPRTRKKHERQRPPHKHCQHRKPARARRRAARLKRSR